MFHVLAILCVCSLAVNAAAICGPRLPEEQEGSCRYMYTEQPPDNLTCNPYPNGELRFECVFSHSRGFSGSFQVAWFYSESSTQDECNATRLQEQPGIYNIQDQRIIRVDRILLRSRLRVLNLKGSSTGTYWCGTLRESGEWLLPSDPLYLQQPAVYDALPVCNALEPVSKEESKCACLPQSSSSICPSSSIDDVISSTLQPVQTSNPTLPSPGSPNQRDEIPRTQSSEQTQTSHSPSPTPQKFHFSSRLYASAITTVMPQQTIRTSIATTSTEDGVTESPNVESNDIPSSTDSKLFYELFIAVGISGLLAVIIVALGFVSIYLSIRKKHLKGKRAEQTMNNMAEEVASSINDYSLTRDTILNTPVRSISCDFENSVSHSYETILSMSHDYEDIMDLEWSDGPPLQMKRNPSYRALTVPDSEVIIVPNPACTDMLRAHDYLVPQPSIRSDSQHNE